MKPNDHIWNMYTLCEVKGNTSVKCMDCETSASAKSNRLKNHKIQCGAVTKNAPHKRSFDTNNIDVNPTTPSDQPATKKMKVQGTIDSSCTTTDAKTKVQLDGQIATAFFVCSILFNVISHPEFRKMIEMLRPGYKPPTR